MFYTAISTAGHHIFDQRIGAAVSDDLHTWERVGEKPTLVVDGRWYKTLHLDPPPELAGVAGPDPATVSETWRDPLVFADPDGDGWHMLVTARAAGAARRDDGVIAHARSEDLLTWEVGEPLSHPGAGFGQLEVLQNTVVDGRPVLVFTCHPVEMTPGRRAASGDCCTWSVPSPGPLGPWDIASARPFTADPELFAAPLVRRRDGTSVLLGFRNLEPRGEDGFAIYEPIPVTVDADGYLVAR
jgi:beta-fructofuranosidase